MQHHPSEFFIKYLMTLPQGAADSYINYAVSSLNLPEASGEVLGRIRADITPKIPPTFNPADRYDKDSNKFLRAEGIWGLYHQDEASKQAAGLLTDLRSRDTVEKLLLGHLAHKDIASKVNRRYNAYYTASGIQSYEHFFWNVPLLKVQDWLQVFEKEDPRKTKAMAILSVGPAMALHTAGFEQQIESKTVLREMMSGLYFDFVEWKNKPLSDAKTKAMTSIAKAAVSLDSQLSQSDAAIKEALKNFEAFRIKHSATMVPDIREVAPLGNFSGSGAKLLDAPREDEDDDTGT